MNFEANNKGSHLRRTKIIATLGPSTDDPKVMEGLILAGASVFRLNMSHGSTSDQIKRARLVRDVSARLDREVALLADLQGPKIRVEHFENGSVELMSGDAFTLDAEDAVTLGNRERVGVSYGDLPRDVKVGDMLLLDDGLISMTVESVVGGKVHCRVEHGGRVQRSAAHARTPGLTGGLQHHG